MKIQCIEFLKSPLVRDSKPWIRIWPHPGSETLPHTLPLDLALSVIKQGLTHINKAINMLITTWLLDNRVYIYSKENKYDYNLCSIEYEGYRLVSIRNCISFFMSLLVKKKYWFGTLEWFNNTFFYEWKGQNKKNHIT